VIGPRPSGRPKGSRPWNVTVAAAALGEPPRAAALDTCSPADPCRLKAAALVLGRGSPAAFGWELRTVGRPGRPDPGRPRTGIDAIAAAVPEAVGGHLVAQCELAVWARELPSLAGVAAGRPTPGRALASLDAAGAVAVRQAARGVRLSHEPGDTSWSGRPCSEPASSEAARPSCRWARPVGRQVRAYASTSSPARHLDRLAPRSSRTHQDLAVANARPPGPSPRPSSAAAEPSRSRGAAQGRSVQLVRRARDSGARRRARKRANDSGWGSQDSVPELKAVRRAAPAAAAQGMGNPGSRSRPRRGAGPDPDRVPGGACPGARCARAVRAPPLVQVRRAGQREA